ncbi:MAG TPA: 16S rRNA (guanine(966)-N(2))-methyltransferase RsmD [Candidatus Izemoplasmatales bacterium]|nr:16S rRNA (guanine(966)-N(2))-methyltransferase RsmD [Candidatus Izemoplasmatales bacterium]
MLRIISGTLKGRKLREASFDTTRPTTDRNKEKLFNILGQYFDGGQALDLFAGSGALGLEALSRGIGRVWFVESDRDAFRVLRSNIESLSLGSSPTAVTLLQDGIAFLRTTREKFDLVFLDPPYASDLVVTALEMISQYRILNDQGVVVAENDKQKPPTDAVKDLVAFRDAVEGNTRFTFYRWRDAK